MELEEWEKLSDEEQKQMLREGKVSMEDQIKMQAQESTEKPSSSKCPASLIELRNAIKVEMADEASASQKYADMAGKFTHFKEPKNADMLRLISTDELLHKTILESIVDEITEECGE